MESGQTALRALGRRYIWWQRQDIESVPTRRIVAQIMDLGDWDDVLRAMRAVGEEAFRDALLHAEPGWFRPRSWTYWHLRLGLRKPAELMPPLPTRSLG